MSKPKHFDFSNKSSMLSFLNKLDNKKTHSLDAFDDVNHLAYTLVIKLKKVSITPLKSDNLMVLYFLSFFTVSHVCCTSLSHWVLRSRFSKLLILNCWSWFGLLLLQFFLALVAFLLLLLIVLFLSMLKLSCVRVFSSHWD